METIECIKTRRSVRKYSGKPIDRETMSKIVEVTSFAPSWKNSQVIRYTIVEDRNMIELLAESAVLGYDHNAQIMHESSVLAVQTAVTGICGYEKDGSYSTSKGNDWEMYDAGISAQTFCLAAHEYGVGTVIMGIFDEKIVKEVLDIPANETVTAVIAMGYPVEEGNAPKRKSVQELMRFL